MGRKILNAYRWLEAHPGSVFTAGLAAVGLVNLLRWQKDKQAAVRLAAVDDDPLPAFERTPKVSFLVPAWNEAKHLPACLNSIISLRYPNKEVVLCAGGEDGSYALAKEFSIPEVIVLEQQPGEGKQGALRRCFAQSTGEIIFLTDADCLLDDAVVEHTLAPILADGEQATTGYFQPFDMDKHNAFITYQWAIHLRYQAEMGKRVEDLVGSNCALRRAALLAAGAFYNEAPIGTDYVLSRKLDEIGIRIHSVFKSRVQTDYPDNVQDYFLQGSRWYRNRLVQGIKYQHWSDVFSSIYAGLASLFIFVGPMGLLLHWKVVVWVWVLNFLHLIVSQYRLVNFFHLAVHEQNCIVFKVLEYSVYAMVSSFTMFKGFLLSFTNKKIEEW